MKHFTSFQLQFAFMLLLLLPVAVSAQKNSNENLKPFPYPVLKSTGNPTLDKQTYERSVKEWNEKELIRNQNLKQVQSTPLTKELKSDAIDSRNLESKKAVSQQNESNIAYIPTIRQTTIIDLPGYPKYVSTGNFELDEKNYQMNKAKWINDNPEVYKNYLKDLRKQNPSTLKRIDHLNSHK